MGWGCAFWPNARWGGSRAARFCAAGEGLPVSHWQQRLMQARAAHRVWRSKHDLCEMMSLQLVDGVGALGGKETSGEA